MFLCMVFVVVLFGFVFDQLFLLLVVIIVVVMGVMLFIVFCCRLGIVYGCIEDCFVGNLVLKEEVGVQLLLWEGYFFIFEVMENFVFVGCIFFELEFWEKFGVNIVYIEWGEQILLVLMCFECIFFGDVFGVIGIDEQIVQLIYFVVEYENGCI